MFGRGLHALWGLLALAAPGQGFAHQLLGNAFARRDGFLSVLFSDCGTRRNGERTCVSARWLLVVQAGSKGPQCALTKALHKTWPPGRYPMEERGGALGFRLPSGIRKHRLFERGAERTDAGEGLLTAYSDPSSEYIHRRCHVHAYLARCACRYIACTRALENLPLPACPKEAPVLVLHH